MPLRQLNPDLPAKLEEIIGKALEKDPDLRYQSAADLRADLRRLKRELESARLAAPALPLAPSPQAPAWGRTGSRWQVPPGSAGLVLRVAVGLAAVVSILVVLVGLNVGGVRERLSRVAGTGQPRIESLAVLPLENLSGDPQQEYFADGMTEALIADLAQIAALRVISRTSVMQYKGVRKPLPEIARELNVDAVVEGSVLRSGDRVRITAQLLHAPTDRHLWAESYERDLRDVLRLQSEVARFIAREIKVAVTPAEETRLSRAGRVDPEAYELYLKGRYHWNRRTGEGFRKALDLFEQSLEKDPEYALAYAGLADTYNLLANYGFLSPREAFPPAKAAAAKALERDDSLAEAYTSLGFARHHYDWDWAGAEQAYRRALELNPGYATAHQWYAEYLTTVGRAEEAVAEIQRARELDPLSLPIDINVGRLLYYSGRSHQAIPELERSTEIAPRFFWGHLFLAMAYEQTGRLEQAMREAKILEELNGGQPTAALARIHAAKGEKAEARTVLEKLQERDTDPYFIAGIYAGLGEGSQALRWLEKSFEQHGFFLVFLKVDPWFDPLRGHPRFQALLERMNYPEPPFLGGLFP